MKKLELYCDGASRGNPGDAAYGFVIYHDGDQIDADGGCIGTATNNIAEYESLVNGLKRCIELEATHVTIRADSQLMVRQINGQYKVKAPQLKPLFQKARELLSNFEQFEMLHVRRELNTVADAMANKALDNKI